MESGIKHIGQPYTPVRKAVINDRKRRGKSVSDITAHFEIRKAVSNKDMETLRCELKKLKLDPKIKTFQDAINDLFGDKFLLPETWKEELINTEQNEKTDCAICWWLGQISR